MRPGRRTAEGGCPHTGIVEARMSFELGLDRLPPAAEGQLSNLKPGGSRCSPIFASLVPCSPESEQIRVWFRTKAHDLAWVAGVLKPAVDCSMRETVVVY
jgi:hypothetical protein